MVRRTYGGRDAKCVQEAVQVVSLVKELARLATLADRGLECGPVLQCHQNVVTRLLMLLPVSLLQAAVNKANYGPGTWSVFQMRKETLEAN